MTHHRTWRERIGGLIGMDSEPVFETSHDSTLAAFGQLFITSELASFDANKRLRTDALSPLYDCETESVLVPGGAPDAFVVVWTPVWGDTDPLGGFHTGRDSAYLGSTLPVAMPPDERTEALLLLVTSEFIHLSGHRDGANVVVRGAVDEGGGQFRFVELAADVLTAAEQPIARAPRETSPETRT
ncbi:MAG: hypothetical protein JWM76_2494 [Pseudonocardiales bacterium]|nr:hypothetical protein [Pseudonocardiales bacterium]